MENVFSNRKSLEERFEEIKGLLSEVTQQPVISEMNPERFDGNLDDSLSFEFNMLLGAEYRIHMWQNIKKDDRYSAWFEDDCGFELNDKNGKLIGQNRYSSTAGFSLDEYVNDPAVVNKTQLSFLLRNLGGIDVHDTPFMDYESYTLDSLDGEH